MSTRSFPHEEHVQILIEKISAYLRSREVQLEVAESGIDRYRCQYRFALLDAAGKRSEGLAIHFQVAERLLAGETAIAINRMVDGFLQLPRVPDAKVSG